MRLVSWLAVCVTASIGCGGAAFSGELDGGPSDGAVNDSGGSDAARPDASPSDGGAPDSAPPPLCPPTEPASGSACAKEGLQCEYGKDQNPQCNDVLSCNGGTFAVLKTSDVTCPTPAAAPPCPSTYQDALHATGACNPMGTQCAYPQGRCSCTLLGGPTPLDAGSGRWMCEQPQTGCPQPRPDLGTPCSLPEGTSCDYGGCFLPGGSTESCRGGIWVTEPTACPAYNGN